MRSTPTVTCANCGDRVLVPIKYPEDDRWYHPGQKLKCQGRDSWAYPDIDELNEMAAATGRPRIN